MIIAIASGKGGTGKTTIATNLAQVAAADGREVAYLDCDVEEPNGHLFLKPAIAKQQSIDKLVPAVAPQRCTFCGRCSQACRYGAIACVGNQVLAIAGGMGQRAQQLFAQSGIQVLVGAPAGTPEELVAAYLDGSLKPGENTCDH